MATEAITRRAFFRALLGAALSPAIAKLSPAPVLGFSEARPAAAAVTSLALLGSAGELALPYESIKRLPAYARLVEDYRNVMYCSLSGAR